VQDAVAQADVKQQLQALNMTARGSSPAALRDFLAADIRRWDEVIAKARLQKL